MFALLEGLPPASGAGRVEYAVFHAGRSISIREAPNVRERHILTYPEFMAQWRAAAGEAAPVAPNSWPHPLGRLLAGPGA